ncbi:MAG: nitronate monooxygenase family protein [Planctomycetota bacterium]
MSMITMPGLRLGTRIIPMPVIQGGMGVGISLAGLASAVAREGGIGVISSVGIGEGELDVKTNYNAAHKRALIREIEKARATGNGGAIGVNIMVALTDFDAHVEGAVEAKADFVFMGAGLPQRFPESLPLDDLNSLHTRFVPIVSSAKATQVILRCWSSRYKYTPDMVVVEGPLAGGHLGFRPEQIDDPAYALEKLVAQILEALKPYEDKAGRKIALVAGGGVFSGADIHRILSLGASGVQMATRFVTTTECDADPEFKKAYIDCTREDLMIIKSPVGLPGRAIRNRFLEEVEAGGRVPYTCPWKCLRTCDVVNSPYCIANALVEAKLGRFEHGFAFAGANAWQTKEIVSVKELFAALTREYAAAVAANGAARGN